MIDVYFRSFSKARWDALALNRGLVVQAAGVTPVILVPAPGVAIDEIGNVVRTPAVYSGGALPSTVVTPAVVDSWWTVNVRLYGQRYLDDVDAGLYPGETDATVKFTRSKLVRYVRENGAPVSLPWIGGNIRAYQFGTGDQRVQVLDSRDVPNPPRVWLGGMVI
jgi:hypothetical protein